MNEEIETRLDAPVLLVHIERKAPPQELTFWLCKITKNTNMVFMPFGMALNYMKYLGCAFGATTKAQIMGYLFLSFTMISSISKLSSKKRHTSWIRAKPSSF